MKRLDDLLAPLGADTFFASVWERAPKHLPGDPARGSALCSHAMLVETLTREPGCPAGLLVFPAHMDPGLDNAALLADPAKLSAYLDAGHPLVWNRARGFFPAIDALAAQISEATGALVWPNVYATGLAGTPFDAHFDAHEVIVVQCEGQKRWWFSEVRVDRPLDLREMEEAVAHALCTRKEEALARTLFEVTVAPGDVLYVPRGQFHNASAVGGRSLHVTFGIRLPTGIEALQHLTALALGDPVLREYLAPRASDQGASADEIEALTARLRAWIVPDRVADALETIRSHHLAKIRAKLPKGDRFE